MPAEPTALVAHVSALLEDIQANLLAEATAFRWVAGGGGAGVYAWVPGWCIHAGCVCICG